MEVIRNEYNILVRKLEGRHFVKTLAGFIWLWIKSRAGTLGTQ
jgi:hypothetical protein